MSDFIQLARAADIPDPGQQMLEIDERLVVLMHVGGQFFCLDDVCTHDGGPLSDGHLEDHSIVCPRHGAKFDIRDGKVLTMPATENTPAHEVQVRDGWVWVKLNDQSI